MTRTPWPASDRLPNTTAITPAPGAPRGRSGRGWRGGGVTPGGGGAAPEARWRLPGRRARSRRVTAASGGAGGGRRMRRREGSGGGEVGGGLSPARSAAGHAAEPEHAAPGAGLRFGGHVISYQSVQPREAWVSGLEETRHRRTYGKGQRGP